MSTKRTAGRKAKGVKILSLQISSLLPAVSFSPCEQGERVKVPLSQDPRPWHLPKSAVFFRKNVRDKSGRTPLLVLLTLLLLTSPSLLTLRALLLLLLLGDRSHQKHERRKHGGVLYATHPISRLTSLIPMMLFFGYRLLSTYSNTAGIPLVAWIFAHIA